MHQWKGLQEYYSMESKKFFFFKAWNWIFDWSIVPHEKKSPWIFQNQSYISNWYIIGKRSSRVLQLGNPKFRIFFRKFKIESWLVPKSWNHLNFVNISTTLVIDASMDRSLWVVQHGIPNIWIFWKSLKLNLTCIMTCDEELKSTFK